MLSKAPLSVDGFSMTDVFGQYLIKCLIIQSSITAMVRYWCEEFCIVADTPAKIQGDMKILTHEFKATSLRDQ